MTRNSLALALISLVLWGMAAETTNNTGPLEAYKQAINHLCKGDASQAFRTFWTAAEAYYCRNDIPTLIGLVSIAAHLGAVISLVCSLIPEPRRKDDRRRDHEEERDKAKQQKQRLL